MKLLFLRAGYLLVVEVLDLDFSEFILLHVQKLSKLESSFFHYASFPVRKGFHNIISIMLLLWSLCHFFLMNFFDRKEKTTAASGVKTYESFPSKKIKSDRRSVQNSSQEAVQAQFMS